MCVPSERAPAEDVLRKAQGTPAAIVARQVRNEGASPNVGGGVFVSLSEHTMPTAKKEATIEELREQIAGAKNLFFTNYQGLTVEQISKLRNELRKDGSTYGVVKNTLFKRAAGDELASQLDAILAGPTGVVFAGDDPVAPAKALKTFSDTTKPVGVKAAYIDGKLVDAAQVQALAALPPKLELLARLVGSLKSPLQGLVMVLSGNQSGLVRVLNAIRESKSADQPAAQSGA
jgi:large subunit ribosomal protein L10